MSAPLSRWLMKNCELAECGSAVRAIAIVPRSFLRPFFASFSTFRGAGFCSISTVKPPPWIMKPGMTR
ncbi:MAG: hypothetical protein AW07_00950 [Candidatus Accumulibacter sp. SK-11]|nr:MAG: hypothetical protein AW07_00950 [Candidatus Accumulibacter sp. SK-11]